MQQCDVLNMYLCLEPDGKTKHYVNDLPRFCEEKGLNYSAMVNTANGWIGHYKRWRCWHWQDISIAEMEIREVKK